MKDDKNHRRQERERERETGAGRVKGGEVMQRDKALLSALQRAQTYIYTHTQGEAGRLASWGWLAGAKRMRRKRIRIMGGGDVGGRKEEGRVLFSSPHRQTDRRTDE